MNYLQLRFRLPFLLHQQQAISSWLVQSPSLHWGGSKWLVNSPRVSSSDDPLGTFFLVFYPCCSLSGHRRMAFLIPNDCLPSSFTFLTTPFIIFSNSKPLIYLTYCCYSFSCFSLATTFTPTLAL